MQTKAFTLIELLIVIAIIGILASAVVFRYPMTIKRVKDSRIMTDFTQFRVRARVLFEVDENYNQTDCAEDCSCPDDILKELCQDAWDNSDEPVKVRVDSSKNTFCAVSHLQDYDEYFCVDYLMRAKRYAVSPADAGGACASNCNPCACE